MSSRSECYCPVIGKIMQNVARKTQEELLQLLDPNWRKVIVLAGLTGVGKTDTSLLIAERLHGEIISADSVQVYRGMDIGTAKVSIEARRRIPHYLIDILDCIEPFNVVDFYTCAHEIIHDIIARGKVPIIVGGTGFYLHTLLYGIPKGPPSHPEVRHTLEDEVEKFGIEALYDRLEAFDPIYAKSITKGDEHKIVRALEIIQLSGKPVSSFSWKQRSIESFYHFLCYFMHRPRSELYPILERRCDKMLAEGFLEEVVQLDRQGIRKNRTACQAIGYKQTLTYLETGQTQEDYCHYVESFKKATRHLAKRQLTWFRKETNFVWIDMSTFSQEEFVEMVIADYNRHHE